MPDYDCDLLVIGGGATGVCAAYDAARRGLRVILADMNDLTTGTSGRFHGLLHSGARYAVHDVETARECIAENSILRRIAPHIVEDTGGLFVAAAHDPDEYGPKFTAGCAVSGIPAEEISAAEARRQEPALRADIKRAFRVPDGAVDGFDLGHAFALAAAGYGAQTLIYRKVTALQPFAGGMIATLVDRRTGTTQQVEARWVLNAAGPWAGEVAALAGYDLRLRWNRGVMIAMNTRWVNTIINRLRPPDDGDILVPVGTVSVIGTTSILVDRPDDNTIEAWEVSQMMEEGEAIIAGFRRARALRAWAGVRPLYEPPGVHEDAAGREMKRTFEVLRHGPGLTSVVGGKLTTARLMAEKAVDDVCAGLGVNMLCTTAQETLPIDHERRYHRLGGRMSQLESGQMPGALICECEMIGQGQLEAAIRAYDHPPTLDDLRRDLRLGMGPCQGGFCAVRAAGILRRVGGLEASAATAALRTFVNERFKGGRPLLWGHHLRQFMLDEMIYRRVLGLDLLEGQPRRANGAALPGWSRPVESLSTQRESWQVIVIGAGLAGLWSAVQAALAGARVRVLAAGIGRLALTPGWVAAGPYAQHPGVAAFASWCAENGVLSLAQDAALWPTTLGAWQHFDAVQAGQRDWDGPLLVVGFAGWRDFDPHLCAGNLNRCGVPARAVTVDLPRFSTSHWDLSPTELAHLFDAPAFSQEVARLVKGRLRDEAVVAFPAVLGLHHHAAALQRMAEAIGRPVIEIPTLPPSVPGTRLFNALKRWLLAHGAQVQIGHGVIRALIEGDRVQGVAVASAGRETVFHADAFILATGGLYGGGILSDDRGQVWEAVFGLPVQANADRLTWFNEDLLDPAGHPAQTFGIRVDESLRPLAQDGSPACVNLFAAGHIIGGADRLLADCEEGFDLASAHTAVGHALRSEKRVSGIVTAND